MAILVLNRFPKTIMNYEEWFNELDDELYMFAPESVISDFENFTVRKSFDVLSRDARVEFEALELFREKPFRRIVALEESEIIRAGLLRERLQLDGQGYDSAVAFRNKVIMKSIAQQGGIAVGPFQELSSPLDLYDFIMKFGLPVVVKPTEGMASISTVVLKTDTCVKEWLKQGDWRGKMVESFVEGDMYHVNGIVIDNEIRFVCSFGYLNNCLSFREQKGLGEWMLSSSNPFHHRLVEFTRKLLLVMPTPSVTTFHLEVFHTPDDQIVLCEIASRTSGAAVPQLIKHAVGIEMDRYIARAQCGLVDELPIFDETTELVACYYIPPKHGVLSKMIEELPFDWCIEYRKNGRIGQQYQGPVRSIDNYAIVIVRGNTEDELLSRLETTVRYVEENTVWTTE